MAQCRTIRIITGTIALAGAGLAGAGLIADGIHVNDLFRLGMLILVLASAGFLARLARVGTDVLETVRQAGYDDGYADGLEVASPTVRRLSAVGDLPATGSGTAQ